MSPDSRNQILLSLSSPDLKLLAPHLSNTALVQGKVLLEQDQLIDYVNFPSVGMVSLVAAMKDGGTIELAAVGREGVVGPTLAEGTGQSPIRAVVQVSGEGSRMKAGHFNAAVRGSETLRGMMSHYSEALMSQVVRTVACNARHVAEARLSRWLLMVHDRIDGNALHLTQEFLGQMLGVQRTTVTLTAHTLQTAGLIRYRRGHIEILNREGLEETACECYEINRRHFDRLMSLRPA